MLLTSVWVGGTRASGTKGAPVLQSLISPFSSYVLRSRTGCYELMIRFDVKTGNDFDPPKHPLQYCAQFAFNPEIPIKPVTGPHRALYAMQSSASSFITCKNAAKENVHLIHRSHTSQQLHETKCQTASKREHNRSMIHDAPR